MNASDGSPGWCCIDCLMLLANGETPPEMDGVQTQAWLAEIERRTEGYEITLGMLREFHDPDCDADETGWDDYCETKGFSWRQCDVCGSTLAGERNAVTFWKREHDHA